MKLAISINKEILEKYKKFLNPYIGEKLVLILATFFSIVAIVYCFTHDLIVRYGDAESHLNIAKRVVDSITPGFAQLGGIWLPLPHVLMLPFIWNDFMWRSGLAGSVVSGIAYIVASVFIYKTVFLLLDNKPAAFVAAMVFMLNPNILYMQSTPMTELVLICFFILSSYYFIKFLLKRDQLTSLLLAAFYGFCSVLSRYDGWFLVAAEAGIIVLYYIPWPVIFERLRIGAIYRAIRTFIKSKDWQIMEGSVLIYITLAFFGIIIWFAWDWLILGDPLYFTHSQFSAAAQQQIWLQNGQLPANHNLWMSFLYYFVTAMSNSGILIYFAAIVGLFYYLGDRKNPHRLLVTLILAVPFIFNVTTLFLGQSVIFIPHLTPLNWDHSLFNVRYGIMTIPLVAFAFAYLFKISRGQGKLILLGLFVFQFALYGVGYSQVVSYQDGRTGLSAALRPEPEQWLHNNYDYGLVLMDDYARTVSVVRSGVPMQDMLYIGNKPYWLESLEQPEKYARWIVMQEHDTVWQALWDNPQMQNRLYTYFDKVYTSPNILIFRRKRPVVNVADELWDYQCVDTMKYSRDAARALIQSPDLNNIINKQMDIIAGTGANCVSIGTAYDPEFVPYLTAWVNSARAHGLKVWFRGNMSGWEGWFDHPKFTNIQEHHDGIKKFITENPTLFKDGDIFTPAPEPENGFIGDPRNSAQSKALFTQFITESYNNCVKSFEAASVNGVKCGWFSLNGDVARDIMTSDLVAKTGGVIVVDHYVPNPEQVVSDAVALARKYSAKVVLGEYGAPIPDLNGVMTESQQADYMDKLLNAAYKNRDEIAGLNYWVLSGGSTTLVNDDGSIRAAAATIKNYYAPSVVTGTVYSTLGQPLPGVDVALDTGARTVTNGLGEFAFAVPENVSRLEITYPEFTGKTIDLSDDANQRKNIQVAIEPASKSFVYKVKEFFAKRKK